MDFFFGDVWFWASVICFALSLIAKLIDHEINNIQIKIFHEIFILFIILGLVLGFIFLVKILPR